MDAVIRERLAACSTHTLLLFLRAGGKAILIFLHNCYCAHTHQLRMIGSRVAVGLHADVVACRSKNAEGLYAERLAQRCKGSGFCLTRKEKIFQKGKKKERKKGAMHTCRGHRGTHAKINKSTCGKCTQRTRLHKQFQGKQSTAATTTGTTCCFNYLFYKRVGKSLIWTAPFLLSGIFEERACFAWLLSTQNVPTTEHDCTAGCGLCSRE